MIHIYIYLLWSVYIYMPSRCVRWSDGQMVSGPWQDQSLQAGCIFLPTANRKVNWLSACRLKTMIGTYRPTGKIYVLLWVCLRTRYSRSTGLWFLWSCSHLKGLLWGIDILVIFELRNGLLQIWTQRRRSRMTLTEGQRGAQRFHPTGNVELFDIVWLYYLGKL